MATEDSDSEFAGFQTAGSDYDEDEDVEWKDDWSEGDTLEGELRDVIKNAGANDNRLYKFCTAPGEYVMVWSCASIRRDFASLDVNVGDVVKLRYEGQYETDDGHSGKDFTVGVR
jgi:hypothetical protein